MSFLPTNLSFVTEKLIVCYRETPTLLPRNTNFYVWKSQKWIYNHRLKVKGGSGYYYFHLVNVLL